MNTGNVNFLEHSLYGPQQIFLNRKDFLAFRVRTMTIIVTIAFTIFFTVAFIKTNFISEQRGKDSQELDLLAYLPDQIKGPLGSRVQIHHRRFCVPPFPSLTETRIFLVSSLSHSTAQANTESKQFIFTHIHFFPIGKKLTGKTVFSIIRSSQYSWLSPSTTVTVSLHVAMRHVPSAPRGGTEGPSVTAVVRRQALFFY